MKIEYPKKEQKATQKINWNRDEVVSNVLDFDEAKKKQSQRQFAKEQEIPRTTLQYWLARKKSIDASSALINFFESSEGLAFLHRLITAAHFVFTKDGVASIHNVNSFLELSGLSPFVASSYATQCRVSNKMDDLIIEFGETEQAKLSQNMPTKQITLASDETFHPQTCLVSIEPVSNFILVEKYVESRDGKTWNSVVKQSLKNLPVKVIQVTSDEGEGLVNHACKGLNVHHSSDCFHVPHEIGKGSSGALASVIKNAEKGVDSTVNQVEKEEKSRDKFDNQVKRPRGRRPDFEKKIRHAREQEKQSRIKLERAIKNQEDVRSAKVEIGEVYHPYNAETGEIQNSEKVSKLLESCFDKIQKGVKDLSDKCKQRIEKAHRVVKNMVATVEFFFHMIETYMDNIQLSDEEKQLMHVFLIPGFYLLEVAEKENDPGKKARILKKAQELLWILDQVDGPFSDYSERDRERLKRAAQECAQIFQRSSSCVEGRNAQLSLRHHGLHRLSDRCLKAQTVVHNYYTTNKYGETPAERFFEAKHNDLFEWLLDKMEYPARPRKRRLKAA